MESAINKPDVLINNKSTPFEPHVVRYANSLVARFATKIVCIICHGRED
jgi:hypothetical protein